MIAFLSDTYVEINIAYNNKAKELFEKDLELSHQASIKGFPTIVFYNQEGRKSIVYGCQPYKSYEEALLKMHPSASKQTYSKNELSIIKYFGSLTAKELSVLSDVSLSDARKKLSKLTEENQTVEIRSRKGSLWKLKNII